jgi:type I restriction enzyme S subunit
LGEIKALILSLPPFSEQHRIVAEVERRLSVVDELEAIIAANLKRAERLRQAILKRAFEGKLVPQDPTDEPASVLLERIRAERAQPKATPKAAQKSASPPRTMQPATTTPGQGELALHYRA